MITPPPGFENLNNNSENINQQSEHSYFSNSSYINFESADKLTNP